MASPVNGSSPPLPSSNPSPAPAGSEGLVQRITTIWTRAKTYLVSIFSRASEPAISSALASSPSSRALPAVSDPDESPSSFPEDASASSPDEPIAPPATHNNRAQVGDTLMEFTFKVDGQEIKLRPDLIKKLIPLFKKLAETDASLKSGFIFTINLKDPQDVHFYHDGAEILKKECGALLSNPAFRGPFDDFVAQINANQRGNWNIGPTETEELAAGEFPDYIQDVPGDGNCLLHAALININKKRRIDDEEELTAENLRNALADQVQRENDPEKLAMIKYDIVTAREFATEKGINGQLPHTYLFSPRMNALFRDNNLPAFDETLREAYALYIESTIATKTSLGLYAIDFLNGREYLDGKLVVVQRFTNRTDPTLDLGFTRMVGQELLDIPEDDRGEYTVILFDTNHYQFIDSESPDFWIDYQEGKRAQEDQHSS